MRSLLVVWLVVGVLVVGGRSAAASPAEPVRVHVECEEEGRTKACPAFLLGFVDAHKVLLSSPRAGADVVVYAAATGIAQIDRLHLRFVGTVRGAPSVVEVDVELDSRADDDAQRAQLEPAFLRGISLFVAARFPEVVTVAIATPADVSTAVPSTTPWGVSLSLGSSGNRTERYKSFNGYSDVELTRVTRRSRVVGNIYASGSLNRQPPLTLDDGTKVSLDTQQWSTGAWLGAAWSYDPCWSFGGAVRGERDDPKGQYRYTSAAFGGVEWDKYAADDPRGNRLAILYKAGLKVERYNIRNELGEKFAAYASHGLTASGTLRKDKVGIGLSLGANAEVLHPGRRHNLTASPFIEWQLGPHVDLNLSFSVTKRELPAPDVTQIDPADFELASRLSYAEPLSTSGSLNVTFHLDRMNGARNDRFNDI